MHVVESLDTIDTLKHPPVKTPVVVTIGNFEGVHLGHQALLKHVVDLAHERHKTSTVITFSNHPSEILRPHQTMHLLCTTEHKIKLFKEFGIALAVLLPFTKEFSQQTAEQFLKKLQQSLPFDTLILGSDAHIGKDREGDRKTVAALAERLGFTVDYFPDCTLDGHRISSSRIRHCIQHGQLDEAARLLGRPYSIYGKVLKGKGHGVPMGFPTANLSVDKLCLPPHGVYAVTLLLHGEEHHGVANLGRAPTLHHDRETMLEVHLFDKEIPLYGRTVDVQLKRFIRPEKHFDSLDALKQQIKQDVICAKKALLRE